MTVYFSKRRQHWLYNFVLHGKRYSGYCRDENGTFATSRSSARMAEEVERRRIKIASRVPETSQMTVAQVVAALMPTWKSQTDWSNKQRYLKEVLDYFGRETAIASIDEAKVRDLPTHLLNKPVMVWTGGNTRRSTDEDADEYWKQSARKRTASTINLFLPVVRMIFERAAITRDPDGKSVIERVPKLKDLPVPKRKARPVPDNISLNIIEIAPTHLVEAMKATLYFGFRRGEIFGATVNQVDLQLGGFWLDASHSKNKEDAFMPGAPAAMEFLEQLVKQAEARGTKYLITWRRFRKDPEEQEREPWVPIKQPRRAWSTAMDTIEKKYGRRFRWHDLRAAFITHVALTSGALAAQRLARHSDFSTTQAYIEVADDVRREAATKAADRPALRKIRKLESQTADGVQVENRRKSLK